MVFDYECLCEKKKNPKFPGILQGKVFILNSLSRNELHVYRYLNIFTFRSFKEGEHVINHQLPRRRMVSFI